MSNSIVQVADVHKSYPTGEKGHLDVLRGAALEVEEGQVVAIVGASGAGKSTLLHIIGALDRPDSGRVLMDGEDMFAMNDHDLAAFRNRSMGFVFQFHHLLPEFSARENIAIPAMIGNIALDDAQKRADELLELVRVQHRAEARPSELSGGEQQRVAVARALVNRPRIVLADEPSGNLDEENAALLHDLLWNLAHEQRQTFIIVTHDPAIASRADATWRLHDGKLLREE
ncbi:MAG: lipoprotein-releasing system ATP-binding protein LolD [Ignavibacteria bacterium]|mgnify:FL=1|nr:MAG: lipoprotein-releasing system ATP-binding protein LolD [Ignavibacteria bacterium]